MRTILALLLAAGIADAGAQIVSRDSVHLKPIGTSVSGSFVLVNKLAPLPEGEFTLVTIRFHDSRFVRGDFARQQHKMVDVILAQMVDGKLRIAVAATAVLAYGGTTGWVSEPCKRDDVAFKLDRVPFMKRNYEQNCLVVNRTRNSLGSRATGAYIDLAKWVTEQGGSVPIPVVVDATVTRIAAVEYFVVRYAFNPDAYGCDPRDPAKDAFVDAVIEVGKALQTGVSEGFSGRAAGPTRPPRLQGCGLAPRS